MFDALHRGPVAIVASTRRSLDRCRTFIQELGGDGVGAQHLTVAAAQAALENQRIAALVVDDHDREAASELEALREAAQTHRIPVIEVFDSSLVRPSSEDVEALLAGDPDAWGPLLDALIGGKLGERAPGAFMRPALARSRLIDDWRDALARAIDAGIDQHRSVLGPARTFGRWFMAGLPADDDVDSWWSRLRMLELDPPNDVTAHARSLRDAVARMFESSELHARACLVYTARLLEEGAWNDAEVASEVAIAVAASNRVNHRQFHEVARRLRVGAWLGKLDLEKALSELDELLEPKPALDADGPESLLAQIFGAREEPRPVLSAKRFWHGLDSLEAAKRDVAFFVQGARSDADPEWRDALAALASALEGSQRALIQQRLATRPPPASAILEPFFLSDDPAAVRAAAAAAEVGAIGGGDAVWERIRLAVPMPHPALVRAAAQRLGCDEHALAIVLAQQEAGVEDESNADVADDGDADDGHDVDANDDDDDDDGDADDDDGDDDAAYAPADHVEYVLIAEEDVRKRPDDVDEDTRRDKDAALLAHARARLAEAGGVDALVAWVPVPPAAWRAAKHDAQERAYAAVISRQQRLARLLELRVPPVVYVSDYRKGAAELWRLCRDVRTELLARRAHTSAPDDDQHATLLRAVCEHPQDDAARMAYADWLARHGDSRGEFITLQLKHGDRSTADRVAVSRRELELVRRHHDEWMGELGDAVVRSSVGFRRGFLARCRTRDAAARYVGHRGWATVEHLDTELPELVHPVMRALTTLTTSPACLSELGRRAPIVQVRELVVRTTEAADRRWVELRAAFPEVRSLVVRSKDSRDPSWLIGTPLVRQATSLTLDQDLNSVGSLSIARWLPMFASHPTLARLTISYGNAHVRGQLVFDLVRTDAGIELRLTTKYQFVERVVMALEDELTPGIVRALADVPRHALRVNAAGNRWFGEPFEALESALRQQFGDAITLPG